MITDQGDWSGWNNAIYDAIREINEIDPDANLDQIKIKFGGLRFYVSSKNKEVLAIAAEAERITARTCYRCGEVNKPGIGKMKSKVYMTSIMLCDDCWAKDERAN